MLLNKFQRIYTRRHTGIKNRIGVTTKQPGSDAYEESHMRIIIRSSQVRKKQIKIWPAEASRGVVAVQ